MRNLLSCCFLVGRDLTRPDCQGFDLGEDSAGSPGFLLYFICNWLVPILIGRILANMNASDATVQRAMRSPQSGSTLHVGVRRALPVTPRP
jgi:hypothetical protein